MREGEEGLHRHHRAGESAVRIGAKSFGYTLRGFNARHCKDLNMYCLLMFWHLYSQWKFTLMFNFLAYMMYEHPAMSEFMLLHPSLFSMSCSFLMEGDIWYPYEL
ncbi:hypothetical protein K1719_012263 [Acacia pycnantha]|nr:hypothetical protein K1719_012263 [Acacia pycnantha]